MAERFLKGLAGENGSAGQVPGDARALIEGADMIDGLDQSTGIEAESMARQKTGIGEGPHFGTLIRSKRHEGAGAVLFGLAILIVGNDGGTAGIIRRQEKGSAARFLRRAFREA